MTSVWVVAEARFEWYEIKHICATRKKALELWELLRKKMVADNQDVADDRRRNKCDPYPWNGYVELLTRMKPGDSLQCDYPDLKAWVVEE